MTMASDGVMSSSFEDQPSLHATAASIASLLGHGVTGNLAERMLAKPPLRERLDRALRDRLGHCPPDLTPAQAVIAVLEPTGLTRLALRAGAAWHAGRIAKVSDGSTVRALVEKIGPEFRDVALQDLQARAVSAGLGESSDIAMADLPAAIARDGGACLVAWCEAQPRAVGWRVLLRLRLNARPSPKHVEHGPPVIERVALLDQVVVRQPHSEQAVR
jgi:hypothetical protein